MGPYIVLGIATRYGTDDPGIEFRWGRDFCAPLLTNPVGHTASYTVGTGSLPEVKRPGLGVNYSLSSSAEVKERAELYFYSPSGPSWSVLGRTLLFQKMYPDAPM